ncbi:MAG: hypothetical protein WC781_01865 [Candidatus Pacearchaeota archaeon]|jgi:hypothetical protein
MRISRLIVGVVIICSFLIATGVYATDDLMALQGNIKQSGVNLASGNLTVYIYDAGSGGNLIYNSSGDFINSISAGKYDVMLGNGTQDLSLQYGGIYYFEMYVNGEKFSFNGNDRQIFQSSTGNISLSNINGYANIMLSNDSVTMSPGQNISMSAGGWFKGLFNWVVNSVSSNYLSFNGSMLSFNDTQLNITIDSRAGVYNETSMILSVNTTGNIQNLLNASGIYSTYNSTYATWAYNQTFSGGIYNESYDFASVNVTWLSAANLSYLSTYNETYAAKYGLDSEGQMLGLNLTSYLRVGSATIYADESGLNISGNTNFNSGWQSGGVSIIGGNIFAKSLYVYNITSLAVNNINVNASLIPTDGFDNQFDIGTATLRWKNGYFAGIMNASSYVGDGSALTGISKYNETYDFASVNVTWLSAANLSYMSTYNATYVTWAYNQTLGAGNLYLNLSGTNANQPINFGSNNLTVNVSTFKVDANGGRVGIGTTTPLAPLHIATRPMYNSMSGAIYSGRDYIIIDGDLTYPGMLIQGDPAAGTSAQGIYGYELAVYNDSSLTNFYKASIGMTSYNSVGGGDITFKIGTSNNAYTNAELMRISRSGKVGIGTATPYQLLDVRGNINVSNTIYIQNGTDISAWMYNQTLGAGNLYLNLSGTNANQPIDFGNYNLTVNVSTFKVDANGGRVGIGTTTPGSKLQIESGAETLTSGTGKGTIHLNPVGTNFNTSSITFGGNNAGSQVNSGVAGIYVESSATFGSKMYFGTTDSYAAGSKQRMIIDQLGKVGIGTTTPYQLLDVRGNINVSNTIYIQNGTDISAWMYNQTLGAGNLYLNLSGTNANQPINFGSNNLTINVSTFKVDVSGGMVGIGIANPATTLDINGNLQVRGGIIKQTDGNTYIGIEYPTADELAFVANTAERMRITSGGKVGIGITTPASYLDVRGNVSLNSTLYVNTGGNVGIGTATPNGAKLEVAGNINVSGAGNNISMGDGKIYWDGTNSRLIIQVS